MGMKDVHMECDTCGKFYSDQSNEEFKKGAKIKYPNSACGHETYTVIQYGNTLASDTPFGHLNGIEIGFGNWMRALWERGNRK